MKWFPDKHRGLAIGIRQTGIPIGGALASTVLTYMYNHFYLSSVHLMQGIVAIAGGLLFLLIYQEPKNHIEVAGPTFTFSDKIKAIKKIIKTYILFI